MCKYFLNQKMNPFKEQYKSYTPVQLLNILDKKEDYQSIAVEAAQTELDSRQLTEEQTETAKLKLEALNQKKESIFEKKAKKIGTQVFNDINPLKLKSPERNMKIISAGLGIIFLYKLYTDFGALLYMFTDSYASWSIDIVLYLLPIFFLPVTAYYLYKETKAGWTLLSVFLTYTIISLVFSYIMELQYTASSGGGGILSLIDELYPRKGFIHYFISVLILGSIMYYINTNPIKKIYNINKNRQILSVLYTVVVSLFLFLRFL